MRSYERTYGALDDEGEGRMREGNESPATEEEALADPDEAQAKLEQRIAEARSRVEKTRKLKEDLGVPDAGMEGDNEMHKYVNNALRITEEDLQKLEAQATEQPK